MLHKLNLGLLMGLMPDRSEERFAKYGSSILIYLTIHILRSKKGLEGSGIP